jgi:hypothetical protein
MQLGKVFSCCSTFFYLLPLLNSSKLSHRQRSTHTVAQAIARANTCSDIADQIVRQRVAIGADQIVDDLTS